VCWTTLLRNPNEGLCGQIPNIALRAIVSLYIEHVPLIWNREEKEARGPTLHRVYCVSSVVLMGRETGLPQLLAPLLLTGGKGADLVMIRGNVVLNKRKQTTNSRLKQQKESRPNQNCAHTHSNALRQQGQKVSGRAHTGRRRHTRSTSLAESSRYQWRRRFGSPPAGETPTAASSFSSTPAGRVDPHLQRQEAVAAKIICLEETARTTDRASSPEHLKSAVVIACVMMSLNFMDKVL
jgi:hypothetical protein